MRNRPVIVLSMAVALAVTGCGGDEMAADGLGEQATVEFRYLDSSVPPQYHRSWTLTITADEVHVVVDSYGTVLADVHRSLPEGLWASLGAVPTEGSSAEAGCTGGTTRMVRVTDGDRTTEVLAEACGGQGVEAAEALDAWVAPVLDAIEDWDELRADDEDPSTYQPIVD